MAWWEPVQRIATVVGVDERTQFDAGTFLLGGTIHLALSVTYGIAFAAVTTRLRMWPPLLLTGLVYGLLIYLVNFELFAVFGWFTELRAHSDHAVELAAHLVFGLALAAVCALSPAGTVRR
jgi:hypothetical protein